MLKLSLFVFLFYILIENSCAIELEDKFEWNQLDFAWPTPEDRQRALARKDYVPENNLPLGIDLWKDKLFVTVPRLKQGVPATLTYIPLRTASGKRSPELVPYPSWEANQNGSLPEDEKITSVFRIKADVCDRLWVMDTGARNVLEDDVVVVRRPGIIIYDLNTDQLIRRYEFKMTDTKDGSAFSNVVIDVTPSTCSDAYAYIPDFEAYGIVVYSFKDNKSWRVEHNFFHFDPLSGDFNVGGVNFQWSDGVFGLALSKLQNDGYRIMYFHPLASTKEFSVSTEILRNETLATDPDTYYDYRLLGDRGPYTQASSSYLDEKTGVLFLTQLNRNAISCWNPKKIMAPENMGTITVDNERLIFANSLTIDKIGQLWILSNKLPVYMIKGLTPDKINFRIMKVKIDDAIYNTPCA